ncbi:MAG: hypothetical protein KDA55_20480 [Planctomycetales bacterium]|nr:hypothetical protein [Planctomycetales bacterium]
MLRFDIHLHARPAGLNAGETLAIDGRSLPTLDVPIAARGQTFPISFEEVGERLEALPRMFFEPDGSFVWVSLQGPDDWQVDGVLYDRDGAVLFAELKGRCPAEHFDRLLAAFGWPATAVMMQLTRQAVFVDEATFRRWATSVSVD